MNDNGIYLCAEVGVSWDSKPRLFKLIQDCLDAGAHAIKVQLYDEETIKDYPEALKERLRPMMIDLSLLNEISNFVHANGGELVVTPMYKGAMDMAKKVKPFPVDGFKIRAKDFTNPVVFRDIVGKADAKPIYISVPHDKDTEIPPTSDEVWKMMWGTGVHTVYCRPEYPPKNEEMNLWKSLTYNGISLHSPDWTVHAIACAMHLGYEERRPREHRKRFYCEVHVRPDLYEEYDRGDEIYHRELPLDYAVSVWPSDLHQLRRAIDLMEETIG
jgi:sialic acid synthase SpsE